MRRDSPDTGEILELPMAHGFVAREGRILARGHEESVLPWQSQTNNNTAVVGASASGKTESVIVPNIMQCDSSYLVVDVKGALLPRLGPGLRAAGYEVRSVDFVFPECGDASVNPMSRCVRADGSADGTWSSVLFDTPDVRHALSSEGALDPSELGQRPMALFLHTSDTSFACDYAVALVEHEVLNVLTNEDDALPDRRLVQP